MALEEKYREFAVSLFNIGAVKFGEFKTKIGLRTPIYFDLRILVSYPKILESLSSLIADYMKDLQTFDLICGVPYTALPIATTVSLKTDIPMVMRRKEPKDYGTKNVIEGVYKEGSTCLIIEDIVTSGSSVLETVNDLKKAGIKCTHTIVVLNREQGAVDLLRKEGIKMCALFSLTQLLQYLKDEDCIKDDVIRNIKTYIQSSKVYDIHIPKVDADFVKTAKSQLNRLRMPYLDRIEYCQNPVAEQLFQIMHDKQTNLCLSTDVTQSSDLFQLVEETGSEICMLKTHVDIIEDFSSSTISTLQMLAQKYNFIILEDRKFADIGIIVNLQYAGGLYKISSWADAVTAHSLIGKGPLLGIKNADTSQNKGVFLLAETSGAKNLIDENYTKKTVLFADDYPELLCGFVCQSPLFLDKPGLVHLIPGVHIKSPGDAFGQQYNSPEHVMLECGGDVAVVGRGITHADDKREAAIKYKQLLFDSYKKRLL